MGVPFEALLPYAIMTGVSNWRARGRGSANEGLVLRIQRCVCRKAQGDAERRKEDKEGYRCMGQGEFPEAQAHWKDANFSTAKYDHFTMTSCDLLTRPQ